MDKSIIERVQSCGFDVYMRDVSDTYLFFTDGTNIGYLQHREMDGFSLSTVHIPNTTSGTGFVVARFMADITCRELAECFVRCPSDFMGQGLAKSVVKWRDWDHFHNSNQWNKSFNKVTG